MVPLRESSPFRLGFWALFIFLILASTTCSVFGQLGTEPNSVIQAASTAAHESGAAATIGLGSNTTVRIESVSPLTVRSEYAPGLGFKDWAPAIGGLLGLLGALAAVWMGLRNTRLSIEAAQRNADAALMIAQRTNEATLWQKANEVEMKEIQLKLDSFYGPFLQLSEANSLLAQELRARQPDRDSYRLMVKVFDESWLAQLSPGDRTIVREICRNAEILEEFIRERAAMLDEQLLPYFSRASAHYRILNLAHKGELGTDPTNFLVYVFPYQLTNAINLEVTRLKSRCEQLRASPYISPGPLPALIIPEDAEFKLPEWPSPPRASLEKVRAAHAPHSLNTVPRPN